ITQQSPTAISFAMLLLREMDGVKVRPAKAAYEPWLNFSSRYHGRFSVGTCCFQQERKGAKECWVIPLSNWPLLNAFTRILAQVPEYGDSVAPSATAQRHIDDPFHGRGPTFRASSYSSLRLPAFGSLKL